MSLSFLRLAIPEHERSVVILVGISPVHPSVGYTVQSLTSPSSLTDPYSISVCFFKASHV